MYQNLSLTLNLSGSVVTLIARMTLRTALGRDYLGQWGTCLCLEGFRWFWQGFNLDHCVCNLTDHQYKEHSHFSLISSRMLGMIRLSLTTVGLTSIGLQMAISRFLFTTMINFATIYSILLWRRISWNWICISWVPLRAKFFRLKRISEALIR